MNRLILAYRPRRPGQKAWPADPRWRFLVYVLMGIAAWLAPPWGGMAAGILCLALGRREPWGRFLLDLGWFWLFIAAPLLTEAFAQTISAALDASGLLVAGSRCLTFLVLMMASQWFTGSTTIFEIQALLAWLLFPLGRRLASRISFLAALTIGFIPWTLDEMRQAEEAASLRRGARRAVFRRISALGLPVFIRVLAKARHCSEAIELRGGWG